MTAADSLSAPSGSVINRLYFSLHHRYSCLSPAFSFSLSGKVRPIVTQIGSHQKVDYRVDALSTVSAIGTRIDPKQKPGHEQPSAFSARKIR